MMNYPSFYNDVETIQLMDPLANILGSLENGLTEFCYLDVVKMAGHSCPTVAGAYLMTASALKVLYPDSLPIRGEIKVEFSQAITDGVAGVISNVISTITGATSQSGFKGLNGRFARHSLLFYHQDISSSVRFTRLSPENTSVDVFYDPSKVPANPEINSYMQRIMTGQSSAQDLITFGLLWQQRVQKILLDHADGVITIKTC